MSYLKYSNLCAEMLRASLKEPFKSQAKLKEVVYFRSAVWKDGKPEKQGMSVMGVSILVSWGMCTENWDPVGISWGRARGPWASRNTEQGILIALGYIQ